MPHTWNEYMPIHTHTQRQRSYRTESAFRTTKQMNNR